jgi:hypothetical protein
MVETGNTLADALKASGLTDEEVKRKEEKKKGKRTFSDDCADFFDKYENKGKGKK